MAMENRKQGVVAIVSGGLDSTVMAYHLHADRSRQITAVVSVGYGQRQRWAEIKFAELCAAELGAVFHLLSMPWVADLYPWNPMLNWDLSIPEGPYDEQVVNDRMVVPHRNALMILIGSMHAVSIGKDAIGIGVHGGDHPIYPDCRPEFITTIESMLDASYPKHRVQILHPFLHWTKAQIVRRGAELGVDLSRTWSCYRGGEIHCGTCPTCIERRQAFEEAGITDPTEYDSAYENV